MGIGCITGVFELVLLNTLMDVYLKLLTGLGWQREQIKLKLLLSLIVLTILFQVEDDWDYALLLLVS